MWSLLKVVAVSALALLPEEGTALELFVDCDSGRDEASGLHLGAPLRTVHEAQSIIRSRRMKERDEGSVGSQPTPGKGRGGKVTEAVVHISGLCELQSTLVLDSPLDSNVRYQGERGAIMSGGRVISTFGQGAQRRPEVQTVNLKDFNFTHAALGKLSARGYSCVLSIPLPQFAI